MMDGIKIDTAREMYSTGSKTPFRLSSDSEYVPLYSIMAASKDSWSLRREINRRPVENSQTISKLFRVLNSSLSDIQHNLTSQRESYRSIVSGLTTYGLIRSGRFTFISNRYSLFNYDEITKMYIPIYIMTIHRDDINYVKKCLILGSKIHPSVMKLVVNDKFDVVRGIFPGLRSVYRKYLKKRLEALGIEIEEVSNFNNIFVQVKRPKSNSIDGYLKEMNTIGTEFLSNLKELEACQSDEIELTY